MNPIRFLVAAVNLLALAAVLGLCVKVFLWVAGS